MIEHIYVYFLERPSQMRALGKGIFLSGAIPLLAGLLGHMLTSVIGSLKQLGEGRSPMPLADFAPGIPTWWIPETFAGGLVCAFLLIGGMLIAQSGSKLELLNCIEI